MTLEIVKVPFNGTQLQLLYNIIDEAPGKIGRALFQHIQQHVQAQLSEHEKQEQAAAEKALREKILAEKADGPAA